MPQTSPIDSALIIGKATDPGRTGKNNEDSFDLFEADLQDDLRLRTVQVAVVADGIGGNNAGEVASRIAVEKIRSVMRSLSYRADPGAHGAGHPTGQPGGLQRGAEQCVHARHGIDRGDGGACRRCALRRPRGRQPRLLGTQ